MKFGHIEVPSADPAQSAAFYCERLGFRIDAVQGNKYFWLTRDHVTFLIRPKTSEADVHNVVLYSSSAGEDARGVKEAGVDVQFGADHCHHFRDPDGYPLQIVDPGEDHSVHA